MTESRSSAREPKPSATPSQRSAQNNSAIRPQPELWLLRTPLARRGRLGALARKARAGLWLRGLVKSSYSSSGRGTSAADGASMADSAGQAKRAQTRPQRYQGVIRRRFQRAISAGANPCLFGASL
jgi:hypothetical protein